MHTKIGLIILSYWCCHCEPQSWVKKVIVQIFYRFQNCGYGSKSVNILFSAISQKYILSFNCKYQYFDNFSRIARVYSYHLLCFFTCLSYPKINDLVPKMNEDSLKGSFLTFDHSLPLPRHFLIKLQKNQATSLLGLIPRTSTFFSWMTPLLKNKYRKYQYMMNNIHQRMNLAFKRKKITLSFFNVDHSLQFANISYPKSFMNLLTKKGTGWNK